MKIQEQIEELSKKDTKNYYGKFPLEYSLVMYLVPKNKIKTKSKQVYGQRATFGDKVVSDEELIRRLFISMFDTYIRDKLGFDQHDKLAGKDAIKYRKEFDKLMIFSGPELYKVKNK